MIERFRTFLHEVRAEFNKVTWPKRQEVYGTTVIVVVTCFIFGFWLWAVDVVMVQAVGWIYDLFIGS